MDSPLFRPAALATAACTAVQASAWLLLSLMGLLTSVEILGPTTNQDLTKYTSITDVLGLTIIQCYYPRYILSTCCTKKLILSGDPMLAISIVYLLGSLAWLCSAIVLLQDLTNKGKKAEKLTIFWAVITWIISLLDFVVVILFGVDYANITSECTVLSYETLSAAGTLMTLAARGYALWLFNVVAASLLFRASTKESSSSSRPRRYSDSSNSTVYNSPADALQDSRSMVFQPQNDRPWVTSGTIPRTNPTMSRYPPLEAWDRTDGMRGEPPRAVPAPSPGPHNGYGDSQRGGLAARMTQGPPSQFGSHRGQAPPPPTHQPPPPPASQLRPPARTAIPEPDYDAANAPRRSALKKASTPVSPTPPSDWRQPSAPQQSGRGWGPSSADNRWGGYDNRGYDNRGWQDGGGGGGGGGGGSDRWGRTGF